MSNKKKPLIIEAYPFKPKKLSSNIEDYERQRDEAERNRAVQTEHDRRFERRRSLRYVQPEPVPEGTSDTDGGD